MTNNKDVEIELTFPLLNPTEFVKRLNKIAKPQKYEVFQKDTYFVPAHRNFLDKKKVTEWLRVRETEEKTILNYKNWFADGIHCKEFETRIENVDAFKKILESLDFKEIVVVEKKRSIWYYKNVEIAVDEVKDLGFFIELESKADLEFEDAKKLLYDILAELRAETGAQDFQGYAYQLLEKKE